MAERLLLQCFSYFYQTFMSTRIHTDNLIKTYSGRTVVNHVSIEVKQGEIVGLLGPNGAGKTTTFYMTVGLIKPDEGKVYLDDEDITPLAMYKRARMGIGYLPQEASIFRKLTVEDNISAVLEMTNLKRREQKKKLEELLDEFRLHHVRKSNGDVVSGGERRRTEIARALAVDPKFILLDEPFAGIDPIAVEDIQAIVARLKYKNIGILITDHNVTETLSICDRAYLLIEGKIFKHGTAEELAADEEVRRLYLGRNFELKRKDYLLQEMSGQRIPSLENILYSLGSARISVIEIQNSDPYYFGRLENEDRSMRLNDVDKTLGEIFSEVKIFADNSTDAQLKKEINQILASDYDMLNTIDAIVNTLTKFQATSVTG